jgi:hypothetical protein
MTQEIAVISQLSLIADLAKFMNGRQIEMTVNYCGFCWDNLSERERSNWSFPANNLSLAAD